MLAQTNIHKNKSICQKDQTKNEKDRNVVFAIKKAIINIVPHVRVTTRMFVDHVSYKCWN